MSSHDPTKKPHQNPPPLTPAERALHDVLIGRAAPTAITLAEHTFALAACDLDDWPLARLSLRRARRHVLSKLHGEPVGAEPSDDLWFAARLIVRALDADVGFTDLETIALFDAIGLPLDAVPIWGAPSSPRTRTAQLLAEYLDVLGIDPEDPTDFDDLD